MTVMFCLFVCLGHKIIFWIMPHQWCILSAPGSNAGPISYIGFIHWWFSRRISRKRLPIFPVPPWQYLASDALFTESTYIMSSWGFGGAKHKTQITKHNNWSLSDEKSSSEHSQAFSSVGVGLFILEHKGAVVLTPIAPLQFLLVDLQLYIRTLHFPFESSQELQEHTPAWLPQASSWTAATRCQWWALGMLSGKTGLQFYTDIW